MSVLDSWVVSVHYLYALIKKFPCFLEEKMIFVRTAYSIHKKNCSSKQETRRKSCIHDGRVSISAIDVISTIRIRPFARIWKVFEHFSSETWLIFSFPLYFNTKLFDTVIGSIQIKNALNFSFSSMSHFKTYRNRISGLCARSPLWGCSRRIYTFCCR